MKTVKMTATGNAKVTDEHGNTSKFYAVKSTRGCSGCALRGSDGCTVNATSTGSAHCVPHERSVETYKLRGRSVIFVTKEERDETTR